MAEVLKKVRVQLLDTETGAVKEEVDVLTHSDAVLFDDDKTLTQKYNELDQRIDVINTGMEGFGAGVLLKSVYDTDGNGKVDGADDADKLGGVAAADYALKSELPTDFYGKSEVDAKVKAVQDAADANAAAIELLTNGVDPDTVDGVNDLINYVNEHGTEVTGMKEDISENAAGIAALETEVAKKANSADVYTKTEADANVKAVKDIADANVADIEILEGKVAALEAGTYDDTEVRGLIADNAEAIEALEADSHTHSNKALLDTYTQTEANLADAVAKKHSHANAAELDKIASGDVEKWNTAAGKAHEHANKGVLDGITSEKVAAWDSAESNAKSHANSLNSAMDSRVAAIEGAGYQNAAQVESAITGKGYQTAAQVEAAVEAGVADKQDQITYGTEGAWVATGIRLKVVE